MKKQLFILFISILVSACVSTRGTLVWPDSMPKLEYYKSYYSQDTTHQEALSERAYLEWIKKFYLGSAFYQRGWNTMTDELIASLSENDDVSLISKKMYQLGKRISAEWAKHSKFRVISTRHVSIWGNALLESIKRKEQLTLITRVENDVEELLEKRITPSEVNADRYYKQSRIDDF